MWEGRREENMLRAVEEEGLMTDITSTATLKTLIPPDLIPPGVFLVPGQSLPNISSEMRGE